jgi:hypothetical protein
MYLPLEQPFPLPSLGDSAVYFDQGHGRIKGMTRTNENKVTQLTARYRESPPIIRLLTPQLNVTSPTLAPARIIGRRTNNQDDEVTNVPTTGATVSPQLPHPRTAAVPPPRPQSTFRTSLLDVTTDSIPPNLNVTGTTASPQPTQLTTERRASPTNILPQSFSIVSLDDLAHAEFIGHTPDNEDDDAGNVLSAEATVSPQTGSCAM